MYVGVCVLLLKLISSFITFRSAQCGGQKDDPSSSPEREGRGGGGEGWMTDGQTGAEPLNNSDDKWGELIKYS